MCKIEVAIDRHATVRLRYEIPTGLSVSLVVITLYRPRRGSTNFIRLVRSCRTRRVTLYIRDATRSR